MNLKVITNSHFQQKTEREACWANPKDCTFMDFQFNPLFYNINSVVPRKKTNQEFIGPL